MHALGNPRVDKEAVVELLERGADPAAEWEEGEVRTSMAEIAVTGGDPEKMEALRSRGADFQYVRPHGYTALIDAAVSSGRRSEDEVLELIRYLVGLGAEINGVTSYGESALRILSRQGRFRAVRFLLRNGGGESQLGWTSLMHAVATGTIEEVQACLERGESLEATDFWSRTPWLLAVHAGDVEKAKLLLKSGADRTARGRCGKPALAYPAETHRHDMLNWLIEIGCDANEADDFGGPPLLAAAEADNLEGVKRLVEAGANLEAEQHGETALGRATSCAVAEFLLDAGADPRGFTNESRRAFLGFAPDPDPNELLDVSAEQFAAGRSPRFGRGNPEIFSEPFWLAMIRAGVSAWAGARHCAPGHGKTKHPGWSAMRFGQSLTRLPDGAVVEIGGEHEDSYDPDFYIYNDVFLHRPDGSITIFGYPERVFPPTDFHTATLLGDWIYIIGGLGYGERRTFDGTPVFRLHLGDFHIEKVDCSGEGPGRIHRHSAFVMNGSILVGGGLIERKTNEEVATVENETVFSFDPVKLRWKRA